jgi:hypothetical protein
MALMLTWLRFITGSVLRLIALLGNVDNREIVLEMREVAAAAQKLGLEAARLEVRQGEDIAPALGSLGGRAQALYVCLCREPRDVAARSRQTCD